MRRPSCRRCWPKRWRTWRQSSEWLPNFKHFYKQVCIYIHNAGARQNEPPSMPHNWVPYHPTIYHYIFRIIWWPQIVVIMLIFDTRQSLSTFDLSSKVGVQILELSLGTRKMRPQWLVGESQSFLCPIMRGYNLLAKQVSRSHLWLGLWPTYKRLFTKYQFDKAAADGASFNSTWGHARRETLAAAGAVSRFSPIFDTQIVGQNLVPKLEGSTRGLTRSAMNEGSFEGSQFRVCAIAMLYNPAGKHVLAVSRNPFLGEQNMVSAETASTNLTIINPMNNPAVAEVNLEDGLQAAPRWIHEWPGARPLTFRWWNMAREIPNWHFIGTIIYQWEFDYQSDSKPFFGIRKLAQNVRSQDMIIGGILSAVNHQPHVCVVYRPNKKARLRST